MVCYTLFPSFYLESAMNSLAKGFGKFMGHGSIRCRYKMEMYGLFTQMLGGAYRSSKLFTVSHGGWKRSLSWQIHSRMAPRWRPPVTAPKVDLPGDLMGGFPKGRVASSWKGSQSFCCWGIWCWGHLIAEALGSSEEMIKWCLYLQEISFENSVWKMVSHFCVLMNRYVFYCQ